MFDIDRLIMQYTDKLKGIYEIDVLYNQKNNACEAHYNYIKIHLKTGFTEYDFYHEFSHLKFLTEEGLILYPYPKREYYDKQEYFAFATNIDNIVYDMFVDANLRYCCEVPDSYFMRKKTIFEKFLSSDKMIMSDFPNFDAVIKECIREYIVVLEQIINNSIKETNYTNKKSISEQRKKIDAYIYKAGISDRFEWISYHTLYLREHSEKNEV